MDTTPTDYKYIGIDEEGVARVTETRHKVQILVEQWKTWDLTPKELCEQQEGLSLSQIYSALAYYLDHKETIDDEIERRTQEAEERREQAADQNLMSRLRKAKERQEQQSEV